MLYLDKLFIILMKKLLYAAMLLLGVGIMAVSYKKEGGSRINIEEYADAILGEWSATKIESYENGKKVGSFTLNGTTDRMIVVFMEDGKMRTTETSDGSSDTYTNSYYVSGESLYIDRDELEIKKLTRSELILHQFDRDEDSRYYFKRVK